MQMMAGSPPDGGKKSSKILIFDPDCLSENYHNQNSLSKGPGRLVLSCRTKAGHNTHLPYFMINHPASGAEGNDVCRK